MMNRARLAAIVLAAGCGSGSAPTHLASSAAPPASASPPAPRDDRPRLVAQRFPFDSRALWPGDWAFIFVQEGRHLSVVDLDAGIVRGQLDETCVPSPFTTTPDLRFVVTRSCGRESLLHVWNLSEDSVRDLETGMVTPEISLSPTGPWLSVWDGDRVLRFDVEHGALAEVALPKGLVVRTIATGRDGLSIIEASSEHGEVTLLADTALRRTIHAPPSLWGFTSFGDDVIEFGPNVVRHERLADMYAGTPLGEADLCEPTAATGADFSADGRFVVVRCQPPLGAPFFLVTTPTLTKVTRLATERQGDTPSVSVGAHSVAIGSDKVHEVFDLESGARIAELETDPFEVSSGGARYRGHDGAIISSADGRIVRRLTPNLFGGYVRAQGATLLLDHRAFDTRSRTEFEADQVSRDGLVGMRRNDADGAIAVFDRSGATRFTTHGTAAAELSPSGRWVTDAHERPSDPGAAPSYVVDLHGEGVEKSIPSEGTTYAISDADVFATITSMRARHCTDKGRARPTNPERCAVVRLDDLRSGTTRTLAIDDVDSLAFTPKGDRLFVSGRDAWDVDAKRIVWSIGANEQLDGWAVEANLAAVTSSEGRFRLLDATTGAERARFEGVSHLVGGNAKFLALDGVDRAWIVDTTSFTSRTTVGVQDRVGIVSDDGNVLWVDGGGAVVARRIADERELQFFAGGLPPFTDEFVFDPKDADRVPLRVREGADVLHSRMSSPSTMAGTHGHANLVEDFFAGRDVSPRAAPPTAAAQ